MRQLTRRRSELRSNRWIESVMSSSGCNHGRSTLRSAGLALAFGVGLSGPSGVAGAQDGRQGTVPRAVTVARAVEIPTCTVFADASAAQGGVGSAERPYKTIGAALVAARPGAVICVAEGIYAERLTPGEKHFTLAGGFQRGSAFKVRDSAVFVSKAQGRGGSFIHVEDPAPKGNALTAVDGFEITGYARAIVRDASDPQRFDITNNHIHGNNCRDAALAGAGFALVNVKARIAGNVFRNNTCGRGGAGFLNDSGQKTDVRIERNLIDSNSGSEPESSHGGALYLFGTKLHVTGNFFTRNKVTGWGAGLYVGAYTDGGQHTSAALSWNVYSLNGAGNAGGGMFCDDGARCDSAHEIYYRNCGGNIYLDSGSTTGPTVARFDHLTNVGALDVDCKSPGPGVRIDSAAPDVYAFANAIFWKNAPGADFAANCDSNCGRTRIDVSYSMVQTAHVRNGLSVKFGAGNIAPSDPLFVSIENLDFHLKSAAGRWTPSGYVTDPVTSPLLGKGGPPRAGNRSELGAYGNSSEASYAR